MPVSGFSVEQDSQVQAYRRMRAQYLAQVKQQRMQDRQVGGLPVQTSLSERLRRVCGLSAQKSNCNGSDSVDEKESPTVTFVECSDDETLCGDDEKLSLKQVLKDEEAENARRMSWIRRQEKKILVTSWIL